jgi:hypothetical protein
MVKTRASYPTQCRPPEHEGDKVLGNSKAAAMRYIHADEDAGTNIAGDRQCGYEADEVALGPRALSQALLDALGRIPFLVGSKAICDGLLVISRQR